MKNTAKQNFYNTRPWNEVGLFYNAPEPTRGMHSQRISSSHFITVIADSVNVSNVFRIGFAISYLCAALGM